MSDRISEGSIKKGGLNEEPSSHRPEPPKPQNPNMAVDAINSIGAQSPLLDKIYEREVLEDIRRWEASLTPEQRAQRERNRVIEDRWDILKEILQSFSATDEGYIHYRCILNHMECLDRGIKPY